MKERDKNLNDLIKDFCKMAIEELEEANPLVEDYIKENYDPKEIIEIPRFADKMGVNYRGNIVLMSSKKPELRAEVVVRRNGTIYLA
jgi:hypothetical protein